MPRYKTEGVTPLQGYDRSAGQSLGLVEFEEFSETVLAVQGDASSHTTSGNTLWNRLAGLSAYGAGFISPSIGLRTPKLGPFMFVNGEPVHFNWDNLQEAAMVVDGLYDYMAHERLPVIRSFGAASMEATHRFLNHRIDALE